MSEDRMPVSTIVAAGVGLGFAADALLRAPGGPGLNLFLLFAVLAASLSLVSRAGGRRPSLEAGVFVTIGVLAAAALMWRGSELLRFFAFVGAGVAFALPALHAGRSWVRRSSAADLAEAVVASGAHAALGSFRLLRAPAPEVLESDGAVAPARRAARSALVGVLLAAAPVIVFGALFVSADRVFAGMVEEFVRVDLERLLSHLVVGGILSWLACGYLVGFVSGTRLDALRELGPSRPTLGTAEVVTALGLVNVLFLGFVAVQFRYLFGGAGWVEVTPGLTYAAYAREGFFQLVAATALGLPWLLAADGLIEDGKGSGRWTFRAFAGAQLVLLLAIVASAVQRMRVYLDAYGLTEDRFVAMAVLVWLALLVVWFGATVLGGRRSRFAFGALASAYALVAALFISNPAAVAADSHLDRAAVDAEYLASLGSDATPNLLDRIDRLGARDRCLVARGLIERWGDGSDRDWRSWNAADWRARRLVVGEAGRLRSMAGAGDACD